MRRLLLALLLLAAPAATRADDNIPLDTLQAIKAATVFVKVEAGRLSASGSGFVVRVEGDTGYVVTNQHVVTPPPSEVITGGPGRPTRVIRTAPAGPVSVTAVFASGTKQERSVRAEVVAADEARDLAILQVSGVKNLPKPVDRSQAPKLIETMPVYLFGFPFGAALSTGRGSPAITVGRGTVSSLRQKDSGELALVQLDGDVNPGNSGGPVVDAQGRLVGVAVARIRDSRIGFAIPPAEVEGMMHARAGECTVEFKAAGANGFEGQVEAKVFDPDRDVKAVELRYLVTPNPTDLGRAAQDKDGVAALAGHETLKLTREGLKATGKLTVSADAGQWLIAQTAVLTAGGKTVLTKPKQFRLAEPARVASRPSPTRPDAKGPAAVAPGPTPTPQESSDSLKGSTRKVDDLTVTELKAPLREVIPCLCWDTAGETFFVLEGTSLLRRIRLSDLQEVQRFDAGRKCSWLCPSAAGLLLTVGDLQEVWVLDPAKLTVKSKVAAPSVRRCVSAPSLSVAFAAGGGDTLSVLDLKKSAVIGTMDRRSFPSPLVGTGMAVVSPDGKYLFTEGFESIHRFRVTPAGAEYEEAGPRIGQGAKVGIQVSPDSAYVCLPSGGGNYRISENHPDLPNYGTYVYPVTDLKKPAFTLHQGPYPTAVAFDPARDRVFSQNHDHPLIVFNAGGVKQKEYEFGNRGSGREVRQMLVHPGTGKVLILTPQKLMVAELPAK
jgi:S1-C subfamily serine protease